MSEREESNYRVTDRRKYNPDGTPREGAESVAATEPVVSVEPAASVEPDAPPVNEVQGESPAPSGEQPTSNVISFPGETPTREPQGSAPPQPAGGAREPRTNPVSAAAPAPVGQVENDYNNARGPQSSRLPEASFLSLANMLAVEAAMHLGLIKSPGEDAPPVDLEAARHLIDMLGMLQTKTRGNLTAEEENLLENILADLRMQFVAISRRR